MIKDMSDAAIVAYIADLTSAIDVNFALKRTKGTAWMLRHKDIAIAVKRSRERAGTWSL